MTRISYELTHIQHYYADKKVLDIERLQIFKGSILGLSGPNGSGKSTLLKIMAFAMKPTQGEVWLNGRLEVPLSPRVRSRVTLLTQKPYLLKRTVFDNIAYGLKIRKDHTHLEARIKDSLGAVGLSYQAFAQRKWHELSGGEAQRVAMAARLILKPEVLLLDEPVASVDRESAALIREAALAARDDWGCTLIIASHDLAWLSECSDTRLSIARGRLFSTGMENIIPQPYDWSAQPIKEFGPVKRFDNGEVILLPPVEGPGNKKELTAVIQTDRISIATEKNRKNGYDNQIFGQIISLILEKNTGHIMATLLARDFSLNLSFSPDQAGALGLMPGKSLVLMFRSQDVTWR